MGLPVPHGLEAEDMGLPIPGCRLTALLCAPDLLPTELHVRSRFSAGLLRPVAVAFVRASVRWTQDNTQIPPCH